ncbi:MAG: L-threonylcarbamoyladenylate synthase [Patescibacteria group bacterium]|jgi:tRNA threonylcarbamoyl adenosine modification protein (Sua5/YciO/YrdC/YwlC family)
MRVIKLSKTNINSVIDEVAMVIIGGGIAVLPFDTVYGFLARADDDTIAERIYQIKGRSFVKPLGVVINSVEGLLDISDMHGDHLDFIRQRVPGRYTFVLNLSQKASICRYCSHNGTIGVRIPDSELILGISDRIKSPLVQTSANKSGSQSCFSVDDILIQFSPEDIGKIDIMVDGGQIESSGPSQIYDLTSEKIKEIKRS